MPTAPTPPVMKPAPPRAPDAEVLRHTVFDGLVRSDFVRSGAVAAQLLLTSGAAPRWVVAFVAGNSGAAVWMHADAGPVNWRLLGEPQAIESLDARGRTLRGIQADIEADIEADNQSEFEPDMGSDRRCVQVRQVLLGSVVRDHQSDGRLPIAGAVSAALEPDTASWSRDRLDGAAGYALSVQVLGGLVKAGDGHSVVLCAHSPAGPLRLRLRALTGDTPLTPWCEAELLNSTAADLPDARRSLLFLSYREKLLAGSWRFHTYFGRDTLMALRLLLPVLQAAANNALAGKTLDWDARVALGVVLCSEGYPSDVRKNDVIEGLNGANGSTLIFHAGTKAHSDTVLTDGGRVLCVVGLGADTHAAKAAAYARAEQITWPGRFMRPDIGWRAV